MKKVLIISYYWPPAGGPGVQRVLKFVKYLHEFDWEPVVMTVKNGDFPAIDQTLEKEVPKNSKIYSYPIWEPYKIYRKITGLKPAEAIPVAILAQRENLSLMSKLMNWIRANIIIPDARIAWYFKAIKEGTKIIQKENIDLLFVSSPPHSLQLIGLALKRKCMIPLISDLRDPWSNIHYYQNLNRLKITKSLDLIMELKVLRQSSLVTTVSPFLKKQIKLNSKDTKCEIIYNGYDQSDFTVSYKPKKLDKFQLAYIGNFKANQNPNILWAILAELVAEVEDFATNFELSFTGKTNNDIKIGLEKYNLQSYCIQNDYVPHSEAIKHMSHASVLLFIVPIASNNKGILTGKLFDYLAANKPLLSIGPTDGDASSLLKETNAGPIIDYSDKDGMKNRILYLFRLWQIDGLADASPDLKKVKNYSRKGSTKKLAELMNDLVN